MKYIAALLLSLCYLSALADQTAVVFSDSLADEGRIYAVSNNTFPPYPYYVGRFSNGPTWVEHAFEHRENYAYGGATSGYTNTLEREFGDLVANTGLLGQVDEYLSTHTDREGMEDAVFYIAIGGNDLLSLGSSPDDDEGFRLVNTMIDHIETAIKQLEAAGAVHFTLVGLPNLSVIPASKPLTPSQRRFIARIGERFNDDLYALAEDGQHAYLDMDAFMQERLDHPEKYGFTNVVDACVDIVNKTMCHNPEDYFFWDDIHPTTRVHEMFAENVLGLAP